MLTPPTNLYMHSLAHGKHPVHHISIQGGKRMVWYGMVEYPWAPIQDVHVPWISRSADAEKRKGVGP